MIELLFQTPSTATVGELNNLQLADEVAAGAPLIDIRREEEWEETGVIPASIPLTFFDPRNNYDLDAWLKAFDKVADKDKPFVLVCRRGIRTRTLGRYLDGRPDFGRVYHLSLGISGWMAAGRPVVPFRPG